MIIVVGSGPAAVAATHALVREGRTVTILDVGNRLEPEIAGQVGRMAAVAPEEWSADDISRIIDGGSREAAGNHSKRLFGSRFAFAGPGAETDVAWEGRTGFVHSEARGGLSNVWGAALMPYRREDIADWPIPLAELEPHYRAVLDFVPSSMVEDGLERILPRYSDRGGDLAPSRQGAALLRDLEKSGAALVSRGVHFGRSRLAIRARGASSGDCAFCRMCLAGCPYGLIYNSAETLDELVATGKVTYLPGHAVRRVANGDGRVEVSGRVVGKNEEFRMTADRVFLGAGSLATAAIVLGSLGRFDRPVQLRDSQYFILPLLRREKVPGVEDERMHASAQVFMEIDDPQVSVNLVHLQWYGYSEVVARELRRTALRLPMTSRRFRDAFLGRLLIVQGFLHSNDSGAIELVLRRGADGGERIVATARPSRRAASTASNVARKLAGISAEMRAWPLTPAMKVPLPGSGYHSGGSFPMAPDPGPGETDRLGRLPEMPRVHLIDASVFPSVPATSITLTVMANAHRIAASAARAGEP